MVNSNPSLQRYSMHSRVSWQEGGYSCLTTNCWSSARPTFTYSITHPSSWRWKGVKPSSKIIPQTNLMPGVGVGLARLHWNSRCIRPWGWGGRHRQTFSVHSGCFLMGVARRHKTKHYLIIKLDRHYLEFRSRNGGVSYAMARHRRSVPRPPQKTYDTFQ